MCNKTSKVWWSYGTGWGFEIRKNNCMSNYQDGVINKCFFHAMLPYCLTNNLKLKEDFYFGLCSNFLLESWYGWCCCCCRRFHHNSCPEHARIISRSCTENFKTRSSPGQDGSPQENSTIPKARRALGLFRGVPATFFIWILKVRESRPDWMVRGR